MKKYSFVAAVTLLIALQSPMLAQEQKDEIRKTMQFRNVGEQNWLEVDNVNGSIEVTGYGGSEIQLVVHRTIWGRSEAKIQQAKEEVVLDIEENGNQIVLYVDAPYRKKDGSVHYRGKRRLGYEVTMDFELKVPYSTNIDLKTVNDGNIIVKDVRGDYVVNNVNGDVTMHGLAGAGHVYALNGEVDVTFVKNPAAESYFGSLNGDVRVGFKPGLSADLKMKTFNGQVYTDFDFTSLPMKISAQKSEKNGRFMYKSNEFYGARVAGGGPELKFDAFNGTIYIKEIN